MFPRAYIEYLVHFHGDRDYFECHELLEEYWKSSTNQEKDSIWVGFILLSVSCYHHRRNNTRGGLRTLKKARDIFALKQKELGSLGMNTDEFMNIIANRISEIEQNQPYQSIDLPISDSALSQACHRISAEMGIKWGEKSNLSDELLIHRHAKRDRSMVIQERMNELKKRKMKRSDSN